MLLPSVGQSRVLRLDLYICKITAKVDWNNGFRWTALQTTPWRGNVLCVIPVRSIAKWREKVWWKSDQLLQPDSNWFIQTNQVGSVSAQYLAGSQHKRGIYRKRDWVVLTRSSESGSMSVHTPWQWPGILIAWCHTVNWLLDSNGRVCNIVSAQHSEMLVDPVISTRCGW